MTTIPSKISVHLVIPPGPIWVLEKMGYSVEKHLSKERWEVSTSGSEDAGARINHWAHYMAAWNALKEGQVRRGSGFTTFWITHIDDYYKLSMVKDLCAAGNYGICLSSDTMGMLRNAGVDPSRLTFIVPGADDLGELPKVRIGIASRFYLDGRKNEKMLRRLFDEIEREHFELNIWGSGWDEVVGRLREGGLAVNYDPGSDDSKADYGRLLEGLRRCDYCLYVGWDEGSLATVDALKLGIKTIVSKQGYHIDLAAGIDHLFSTYEELLGILRGLADRRKTLQRLSQLTSWDAYAKSHDEIWASLHAGAGLPPLGETPIVIATPQPTLGQALIRWRRTRWSLMRYLGLERLKARIRQRRKSESSPKS